VEKKWCGRAMKWESGGTRIVTALPPFLGQDPVE